MVKYVNLGCGNAIARATEKGQIWFNLDLTPHKGVDVAADLEHGLPFKSESIDFIYASHVLEHIRTFPNLMKECHRVLKPRGMLHIRVPVAGCRAALADPTHCNQFVPETWMHFAGGTGDYDTLGMDNIGFVLKWNEVIEHSRPHMDDGKPGAYFTENVVEMEKDGPLHDWEEELAKAAEAAEREQCQK